MSVPWQLSMPILKDAFLSEVVTRYVRNWFVVGWPCQLVLFLGSVGGCGGLVAALTLWKWYSIFILSTVWSFICDNPGLSGESSAELEKLGEKWWHGDYHKVGRESGDLRHVMIKIVIIKLKLAWLSRSMILAPATFPWLSRFVILP